MISRHGRWDTESGNRLGFYETQEVALAVVRQELQSYGAASVVSLALDRADGASDGELIAEGETPIEHLRDQRKQRASLAMKSVATR